MTNRAKPMNNAGKPAKNIPLTRVDDRAKEVEAILEDWFMKPKIQLEIDICDLLKRAEVEALEKLDEYLYSDQGVTDIELVQEYVTERLKELRGEK